MKVAITGSSGLIGSALADALIADGHEVIRLVRSKSSSGVFWDPGAGVIDAASLEGVDGVVHLGGVGIGDRRWNTAHLEAVRSSRLAGTTLLASTLAGLRRPPSVLLSASAIGIYGDRGDETLTERSAVGTGFLADLCTEWEAATSAASDAGIRVAHLRTGIVMSPLGGALKRLVTVYKFGLGGRMGSGRQYMSWISLPDEVGIIRHLLTSTVSGPVNLTAPNPSTNAEVNKVLGAVLKRPSFMVVPEFGPKLLMGKDMAQHLLFDSTRVLPDVVTTDGYEFQHTTFEACVRAVLKR